MPRFAVRALDDIPTVPASEVGWHPLTHHLGLTAFGANVFVAAAAGDELVAEHDESESGQEELYLVLRGTVRFTLDGGEHDVRALGLAAVPDASVRRSAVGLDAGATLLALGAPPGRYTSTWRAAWFDDVPKAE